MRILFRFIFIKAEHQTEPKAAHPVTDSHLRQHNHLKSCRAAKNREDNAARTPQQPDGPAPPLAMMKTVESTQSRH